MFEPELFCREKVAIILLTSFCCVSLTSLHAAEQYSQIITINPNPIPHPHIINKPDIFSIVIVESAEGSGPSERIAVKNCLQFLHGGIALYTEKKKESQNGSVGK